MVRTLSEGTRKKVLDAALQLLTEREFGDITTREISRVASVAEATLFRYFSRKEEILDAILDELAHDFFKEIEDILRLVDDPTGRLVALCRKHAQFAAKNRGLMWVLRREMTYERCVESSCAQRMRRYHAKIEEVLRDGIEKGVFRRDLDVATAAFSVHAAVERTLLMERVWGMAPLEEDEFIRQSQAFLDLIFTGIQARTPAIVPGEGREK